MKNFIGKFIGIFLLSALILVDGFFFVQKVTAEILPEPPRIITRTEWGADEALRTWDAQYPQNEASQAILKAKVIVVHHTASAELQPDSDGSGFYKSKVQAIYKWHVTNASWEDETGVIARGFGDIGYHYLIDPNGNIYQGRMGANGVLGAHVYGSNEETIGIAVLGTYGGTVGGQTISHPLTPALKESLQNLIAWLAAANDIDLTKQVEVKTAEGKKYVFGLSGHKDLRATQCPGSELYQYLSTIRPAVNNLAQSYKDYLYQAPGSAKVYLLRDGLRLVYDSLEQFSSQGNSYKKLVSAGTSQALLNVFLDRPFIKYPDGTLLRDRELATVYLLDGGRKRPLQLTSAEFEKLSFGWDKVKVTIKEDLALYPEGAAVKYAPENILIKGPDDRVYLTGGGRRHWITSGNLFGVLGYKWNQVKNIPAEQFENYLEGDFVFYPNGTLAKGSGAAIYLIQDGQKREFTSANIFEALGYSWSKIKKIYDEEIILYPLGEHFKYPDGSLVRAKNTPAVYLIKDGQRQPFLSAQNFLANGYSWSQIKEIESAELAVHPERLAVKYPNGVLIQAENDFRVYAIKNGQPEWIKSEEDFKKAGYKWTSLIKVVWEEFKSLYPQLAVIASALPPTVSPQPQETPSGQTQTDNLIRVGIWKVPQGQLVSVSANGPYNVYNKNNQLVFSKQAGEKFSLDWSDDVWRKFVPQNNNVIMEIANYSDIPAWNQSLNYNRFRGNLEVRYSPKSQSVWVVNELPLESYLRGVAEALSADPVEYQKAFAVISRSYALFHLQAGGKYEGEIFHLNNTSSDQLYKGYVFEELVQNSLVKAVEATLGLVMTYQGKVARALYSSDSGGKTVSACEKWGAEFCSDSYGYLKGGVLDPPETIHNQSKIAASHGVGMSCIGARTLANQGKNYQEILKYYYLEVEVEKKY